MTWIVPDHQREQTPHVYSGGDAVQPVELVVVHWTASPARDYARKRGADSRRIRSWLSGERGRSSTHFVSMRDGYVLQGAPLTARTWHAGQSSWSLGESAGSGRGHVNSRSIGIDLENVGPLRSRDGALVDSYGGTYDGPAAARFGGDLFEPFTRAQVEGVLAIVGGLIAAFPVLADPRRWVGHSDVSPGRKADPGPAFPWRLVRAAISAAAAGQSADPASLNWTRERGVVE